ncbi:MAG: hypothetical protein IT440_07360 [Phycisphaeraceae bacterium]|nr:hypothetical protein [Phycisphaeraceae bacterium]
MSRPSVFAFIVAIVSVTASQPGHAEIPHDKMPAFCIPKMTTPPTVDGRIEPSEWREAVAVSGVAEFPANELIPRPTTYWLAWDDGHLYLACRAWMKPGAGKPKVGGRSPHTASCFDAGMELHFQPLGKNVDANMATTSFKFNVNALGFDGTLTRVAVGQMMANWLPDFRTKTRLTEPGSAPLGGRWLEMEWAGSIRDFELTGPNRAGDTWRMLLGFNQLASGWSQAMIPVNSSFFDPGGYPLVTLVENTPAVQVTMEQLPWALDGVAAVTFRAYNPTQSPVTLSLLAHYADKEGDLVKREVPLAVAEGKTAEFVLNEKFPRSAKDGTIYYRVMQGEKELFRYYTLFKVGYDEEWVKSPQSAPDAKPSFSLSATFNPVRSTLQVTGDSYYLDDPSMAREMRYRVLKAGQDKPVLEGSIGEASTYYFSRLLELPILTPGDYALEATLGLKGDTVIGPQTVKFSKLDEAKAFSEWWGKSRGNIERVIPPFSPMTRTGAVVTAWGRAYSLNALGLPADIASQEKPVLAAPARIVVVRDGKQEIVPLNHLPTFTETREWRVNFEGTAQGAGLVFHSQGWVEQDGLVYVDLSYAPAGDAPVQVDGLYIEFPFSNKEAEGLICLGPGGNFAPRTVKLLPTDKQGPLWSTLDIGRMGSGMTVGSFYSCVWLGNEQRGLLWWGDNDQGWVPRDEVPAHAVLRQGNEVVLRNNIIGAPFTVNTSRTISFGYMASPFRPLVKGWRASIFSYYGQSHTTFKDPVTGKEDTYTHMLAPPFKDSSQWGPYWAAQKPRSDERLRQYQSLIPGYAGRMDTERAVQYSTCLVGYGAKSLQDDVFSYFAPEWKPAGRETYSDSLINYYTYIIDRACREGGLKTIYWDIFFIPGPHHSVQAGAAYVLPDGRVQPGFTGFNARRFFMHTYSIFDENGAGPGAQVVHGTNNYLLLAMPWADALLDGEYHQLSDSSVMDWVDGYPAQSMRVMSCSHTFGTQITWMDLMNFSDKARWERCLRGQIDYIRLFDSWVTHNWHKLIHPHGPQIKWGTAALEWGINDEKTEYIPFWRNPYVQCADKDILVSLWRLPDRVLMVVFNYDGKNAKDVTLKVDMDALGLVPKLPWQEFVGLRVVEDTGEYGRQSMPKDPDPTMDIHNQTVAIKTIQPHTARIIGIRKY